MLDCKCGTPVYVPLLGRSLPAVFEHSKDADGIVRCHYPYRRATPEWVRRAMARELPAKVTVAR